eukprot:TRINITY_DN1023_c0_g1_i2.p1 TRINITY_DN1023_c0_g1~~TRINITY_DN1023_c0_g1_i2.p1  ORF type:complete len:389 (+),score=162.01 TRINITY_DN1023_c0_g1_i2:96-1262(+)
MGVLINKLAMRTILAQTLLVAALAVLAGAVSLDQPTQVPIAMAEVTAAMQKLKTTTFGSTIMSFLEGDVKPQDAKDLFDAFDLILQSLQDLIKEENTAYARELFSSAQFRVTLKNSVNLFQKKVDTTNALLVEVLRPKAERSAETVEEESKTVADSQAELKQITEDNVRNQKEFKAQQKNLKELINAVDKAIGLIEKVKDNLTAAPQLLQVHRENFRALAREIHEQVDGVKHFMYKPLIKALIQMTLKGDFDTNEAIAKILELLNNIRSKLVTQQLDLELSHSEAEQAFKGTSKALSDLITTSTKKLKDAQKELAQTAQTIEVQEADLKELEEQLDQWTDAWEKAEEALNEFNAQHKRTVKDFEEEIALVKQAIQVLENNGVTRPAAL